MVDQPYLYSSSGENGSWRLNNQYLDENFSQLLNSTPTDQGLYTRVPTSLALFTLSFTTAIGNAMVLHAIRTEKRLQTVSNMFIMSLAAADLIVGLIVMPISAADVMTGPGWEFGRPVCQIFLLIDYTASTASIFNLFILSLDRYWSITSPLRYLRRRTKKRALLMIGLAWVASSLWFIPVLGWHHFEFGGVRNTQEDECDTEFAGNIPFKVISAIINFYIPTGCMAALYVRIFLAIKKRSREMETMMAPSVTKSTNGVADQNSDSLTEEDPVRGRGQSSPCPKRIKSSCAKKGKGNKGRELDASTVMEADEQCNGHLGHVSQFYKLTILTFPQDGRIVSSSESLNPLTSYHGVKVEVEVVDGGNGWTQKDQNCKDCWHHRSESVPTKLETRCEDRHSSHLQCYRGRNQQQLKVPSVQSGMIRSRSDNRMDLQNDKKVSPARNIKRQSSANSTKSLLGSFFTKAANGRSSDNQQRRNTRGVLSKEKKAATQLGVIAGAFFFCWFPYFTLFMVVAYCDSYSNTCSVPSLIFDATVWCGYLNSTLNPILYPLCNTNFKRAFKRMLRLSSEPHPQQPFNINLHHTMAKKPK